MDDIIYRQDAIDAAVTFVRRTLLDSKPIDVKMSSDYIFVNLVEPMRKLPSAQPEIIRCKDCVYYDPPHVENNGVRSEYSEMPEDSFDVLGVGLVSAEYGINIGGRCCRDYNVSYSEDKRVFIPETNYCGRAERRTDE